MNSPRVLWLFPLLCLLTPSTFLAQTLVHIDVTVPSTPLVAGGDTAKFTATGRYQAPPADPGPPTAITGGLKWSVENPDKLTIDPDTGVATPLAAGTTYVRATDPVTTTESDRTLVTIAPAIDPMAFFLAPSPLTVEAGKTLTPVVMGNFGSGAQSTTHPVASGSILWGPISDTSKATIAGGTITGVGAGATSIKVSVGSLPGKTFPITVTAMATPAAAKPSFPDQLFDQNKTVLIDGTAGDNISLFQATAGSTSCTPTTAPITILLVSSASSTTTGTSVTLTKATPPLFSPPYVINLAQPLLAGELVCAEDTGPPAPVNATPVPAQWSDVQKVKAAPKTVSIPKIDSEVFSGTMSLTVKGDSGDTISIYQFDPGYSETSKDCSGWSPQYRSTLQVTSGSATAPTYTLTSNQDTVVALSQPLAAGYTLCVTETAAGLSPSSSKPVIVRDSNAFGRFRSYLLFGLQASNQLSGNSSSTAGEYLEAGFNNYFVRALDRWDSRDRADSAAATAYAIQVKTDPNAKKPVLSTTDKFRPGLASNIDIRLSPIPVAATSTTTDTSSSNTSTTPNALSSQQAIRFLGSLYTPFKTASWNNHTDSFTIAPLVRGGFGTLINPSSATPAASSNSSASTSVTSTAYNSAYYFWGFGARLGWDRYSKLTDEAPQTITQFLITAGEYSNLPSYICKLAPANTTYPYTTTNSVVTACDAGQYTPMPPATATTTPTTFYVDSRTLIPRIDIEALAKLPTYPFVLGVDANLQQYTVFQKNNLDILNKPGNDIRIFIGVTIDPATFFSKTGAPSF